MPAAVPTAVVAVAHPSQEAGQQEAGQQEAGQQEEVVVLAAMAPQARLGAEAQVRLALAVAAAPVPAHRAQAADCLALRGAGGLRAKRAAGEAVQAWRAAVAGREQRPMAAEQGAARQRFVPRSRR
jgi:hypothetical protein